jgi:dolichol-phosphate mannosyltransferase
LIKFSIIIPILNEEKNILILTNKIKQTLNNYKYEIIFVDDNSEDNSKIVLSNLKKKYKNISFFIRKNKIRDLFQSCLLGIKKSKYQYNLIMDGDLQHDPRYIPKMLQKLNNNYDIVVACRNFDSDNKIGLNIFRLLSSKIIRYFIFVILGKKTLDPMSGYFVFKKSIFLKNQMFFYGYGGRGGFKILSDIIYNVNNLKISDTIINFKYRKLGESKMNFRVIMKIIFLILFCFLRKKFNIYLRI